MKTLLLLLLIAPSLAFAKKPAAPVNVKAEEKEDDDAPAPNPLPFYLGGQLGMIVPAGMDGVGEGLGVGLTVGKFVKPHLSLETIFTYGHLTTEADDVSVNASQLLMSLTYHTPDPVGLRFGPHFGAVFESPGKPSTRLGLGARIGYDYRFTDYVSLGGELTWTLAFGKPKAHSLIGFMLPVKFYF